jgi:MFS family permease
MHNATLAYHPMAQAHNFMADHRSLNIDSNQRKVGPIWLSPGVLPRHALIMFISGALAVGFINLINLIQPLLLQEQLGMVGGEGAFTARLYVITEITTLLVAAPLANLSDSIGRRPIFSAGFLAVCIMLVILPLAETQFEFLFYRVFLSVGVACCTTMMASLMADYPQNASRGKFIGLNGFFAATGVIVIGSGLTQMPRVFTGQGFTAIEATTYTLWIGSALALLAAVISFTGLKKGRATEEAEKLSFMDNARIGMREIGGNPRLILACAATMLSRGDLTVLASFFSLWVQKVGADTAVESVVASATAGRLFGLMQVAMLLSMPVIATVADRCNRVTTLCIAMTVASLGYFALGFAPNPFESAWIYPVILAAGIGEAVVIVSVPALIGHEAPARYRGSIIGVAATFGALGIIFTNQAAGYLFDNWSYPGPFLFMGILNGLMLIWAVTVRLVADETTR